VMLYTSYAHLTLAPVNTLTYASSWWPCGAAWSVAPPEADGP